MNTIRASRVSPLWIAIAVLGGAAITGCGSSNAPHSAAADDHAAGVTFATCMRSHGVPSFPDPEADAGVQIPTSLMQDPTPAFTSAMAACKHLIPPGGAPPAVSASQKAAALKFAQCMLHHGLSNYPDPTYKDGLRIPEPLSQYDELSASPAFKSAGKACQSA